MDIQKKVSFIMDEMRRVGNELVSGSDGYERMVVDPASLPHEKARLLSIAGAADTFGVRICRHCRSESPGFPRLVDVTWDGDAMRWRYEVLTPERYCCERNRETLADIEDRRARFADELCDKISREIRQDRMKGLLANSLLGERWQERRFDTFIINDRNHNAHRMCHAYASRFKELYAAGCPQQGRGLALVGSAGTGKTHLAAAMTMHLLEYGVAVIFVNFVDMLWVLTNRNTDTNAYIEKLCDADVLVIDDLGKDHTPMETQEGARIRQGIYRIINTRYERKKPIIATTNETTESLKQKLDGAMVDRLLEMWWSKAGQWNHIIKMNWESERTGKTA